MKNQLNLNENSSVLLGAIMDVTPGQAKIIAELPGEAQQPTIDMCKEAKHGDALWWASYPDLRARLLAQNTSEKPLTDGIWLVAYEIVKENLISPVTK